MFGQTQNTATRQSNLFITRFLLVPVVGHKDVYKKPMTVNVDNMSLNILKNTVEEKKFMGVGATIKPINAIDIANTTPNLLDISDTPVGRANIPNGWNTERLRFILEVVEVRNGMEYVSYLQGYSEYYDPSFSGAFDPNMRFFINSITNVIRTTDPVTGLPHVTVQDSFNVLYEPETDSYKIEYESENNNLKLARPKDLLEGIQTLDLYDTAAQDGVEIHNFVSSYTNRPNTSRRANTLPVEHLASTINGYVSGMVQAGVGFDDNDILSTAASVLREPQLITVPVIYELSLITGDPSPVHFSFNDLKTIDPRVDSPDVTTLFRNGAGEKIMNNVNMTNDFEEHYVPTMENKIATLLLESVSGLMFDNLLTKLSFSVTNNTADLTMFPTILNVESFIPGIDTTKYIAKFLNKFEHIVFPMITKNNSIIVELFIDIDLLGDSIISVAINNGEIIPFRFPTFADSLYSNIITTPEHQQMLTSDYETIVTETAEVLV